MHDDARSGLNVNLNVTLTIHHDTSQDIKGLLTQLLAAVTQNQTNLQEIKTSMAKVTDVLAQLQTAVANETTIDQSVLAFIQGIPALITAAVAAANADQTLTPAQEAAFTGLSASINQNSQSLADAVTANTPSAAPKRRQ